MTEAEKADPVFTITPRYWVGTSEVRERLASKKWHRNWLMGWRDITNATNERTVIASVVPLSGVGNQMPLMLLDEVDDAKLWAALLGNLCALTLDFVARHKTGGTHMNYFIYKQLPVLPPTRYTDADLAFIVPRVLELTYTAHDLKPWAEDLGYDGPPYAFHPERRARLRAQLDAYYAKLYGLTRDEMRYILDPTEVMDADYPSETFRVLKDKEIRQFDTYRTQDWVLEAWDALEVQPPMAIPTPKPARRTAPLPVYAAGTTPATEVEDWLAGLVCDVLALTGSCDDTHLQQILTAALPTGTPHADVLTGWLAPVAAGRLPQILAALRGRLGVPTTAPLSIPNPHALAGVMGDHRTDSLAHALIEARRQCEAALAEVMAAASPTTQQDDLQKSG